MGYKLLASHTSFFDKPLKPEVVADSRGSAAEVCATVGASIPAVTQQNVSLGWQIFLSYCSSLEN